MKHRVSISIDQDILLKVFDRLRTKEFNSKSELFEKAINKFLEGN